MELVHKIISLYHQSMNPYLLIIVLLLGVIVFIGSDRFSDVTKNDISNIDSKAIDLNVDKTEDVDTKTVVESSQTSEQIINLSNKGLTKVPDYVFKEVNTQILNLSNNNFTGSLQAEVRRLENLKVLDLSNNNFTGVPAEIGQLKNLEVLNLSGNPITGLPKELANLKNLKSLDLRETNYSAQDLEVIKKGLSDDVIIYLK